MPASLLSSRVKVSGCFDANTGFDGTAYQADWPDGNTRLHPTSVQFSSPLTGEDFGTNYERMAFETDLPAIENAITPPCNVLTGAHCTLIPTTDDGTPANFYPFYSINQHGNDCTWLLGNDIAGLTTNDFGRNAQYGSLLALPHLRFGGGGASIQVIFDFRQILSRNPCPAQ
jgi:hypothetical protein